MRSFSVFVSALLFFFFSADCYAESVTLANDRGGLAGDLFGDPFGTDMTSGGLSNGESREKNLSGDPFAEGAEQVEQSQETAEREKGDTWQRWFPLQKGWLESRNQIRLTDGRAISTRQRLWLEGGRDFFDNSARFFISSSLDFDPAAASLSSDHDDVMAGLHEVYLTFEGEKADFLLGRKMVRWGTGDGINPLDLINPMDQRDPLASGRSDNRLPVFLGQGIFSLPTYGKIQELTLEMVAVPLAKVNRLSAAGSAWEPLALQQLRTTEMHSMELVDQEKPENWFEDGKYALRLTATSGGWDLAVIGYSGARNNPVLVGIQGENGTVKITPEHPRITAFGVNFAKGLERSTLRGELAVKPAYPLQKSVATLSSETSALPDYTKENMMEAVIGVDRTFALNRYLNLQYFATYIPQSEKTANRRYEDGITYELSDKFCHDDLKLGVSGIVGFSGQGWTMQPYAEYQLGDNWLLAASVFLFEGDKDGRYGQFDRRDFTTLRLRWSF